MAVTATSAVLDVIECQKLQENAKEVGQYLFERLQSLLKYEFVGDVRGRGLFQGIDIVKSKSGK
jgi:4-aminobutyrate aminotransferase-like enzyme